MPFLDDESESVKGGVFLEDAPTLDDPLGIESRIDPLGIESADVSRQLKKLKLQGERAALANEAEPSIWTASPSTLGKASSVVSGGLVSSGMKGLAMLDEEVNQFLAPEPIGTTGNIKQDFQDLGRKLFGKKDAVKFRTAVENNPLFKSAKDIDKLSQIISESIPETERDAVLTQLTETGTGAAPMLFGGGAAGIFAITAMGDTFDRTYEDKIKAGMSKEQAANESASEAMLSGGKEALLWTYAPKILKRFIGEKIVKKAGEGAGKQWLAKTGTEAAEMGAIGGTSHAAQNLIEGKPVGEGTAQAALGMAVFGGVAAGARGAFPKRADTKPATEQKTAAQALQEAMVANQIPRIVTESGVKETVAPDESFDIRKEWPAGVAPTGSIKIAPSSTAKASEVIPPAETPADVSKPPKWSEGINEHASAVRATDNGSLIDADGNTIKPGEQIHLGFAGGPGDMPKPWTLVKAENFPSSVNYKLNPRVTVKAANGTERTYDFANQYSPRKTNPDAAAEKPPEVKGEGAFPVIEPKSPTAPNWNKLYQQEHADLLDAQRKMEEAQSNGDSTAENQAKSDKNDILNRLDQFDRLSKQDASELRDPTVAAIRDNPNLTLSDAITEGQRLVAQKRGDAAYDAALENGEGKKAAKIAAKKAEGELPVAEEGKPKEPWQMTEAEWMDARKSAVPDYVDAGEYYEQSTREKIRKGKFTDDEANLKRIASEYGNPDKHIPTWGETHWDTIEKSREWKKRNPQWKSHEGQVEQAIREGKPVPPEVLADYPDLKPLSPTPAVGAKNVPSSEVKPVAGQSLPVAAVAAKAGELKLPPRPPNTIPFARQGELRSRPDADLIAIKPTKDGNDYFVKRYNSRKALEAFLKNGGGWKAVVKTKVDKNMVIYPAFQVERAGARELPAQPAPVKSEAKPAETPVQAVAGQSGKPKGIELRATDSGRVIIRSKSELDAKSNVEWASKNPSIKEVTVSNSFGTTVKERRATEEELQKNGWVKNPDYQKYSSWGRKPAAPTSDKAEIVKMTRAQMISELGDYGITENALTGKLTKNMDVLGLRLTLAVERKKRTGSIKPASPISTKPEAAKLKGNAVNLGRIHPRTDGIHDILDEIQMQGGLRTPSKKDVGGEYDGFREAMVRQAILLRRAKSGLQPDQMVMNVQEAFPRIKTADDLYGAIKGAIAEREKLFQDRKKSGEATPEEIAQAEIDYQAKDFELAASEHGKGAIRQDPGELAVGDEFQVDGEWLRVIGRDEKTGDLTVEDGRRFGVQKVDGSEPLYVEKVHQPEPPKEAPKPAAPKLNAGKKPTLLEYAKAKLLDRGMKSVADKITDEKQVENYRPQWNKDWPDQADIGGDVFNLAGEKGVDAERIAKEKADKEAAAKANEEFQKKNQLELGAKPADEPAAKPAEAKTEGQKFRVGNNPTLHSLVEKLPASKIEIENGEQPMRVKNDKTGEVSTVMESDLTPVKENVGEKPAKVGRKQLDDLLRKQGLDPASFPDANSKKSALQRADAMLKSMKIKSKGSYSRIDFGISEAVWNGGIDAARLALKATGSLVKAIERAIAYIRQNHKSKLDDEALRGAIIDELAPRQEFQQSTAKESTAGQWADMPPIKYIPETHGSNVEFAKKVIAHFGNTAEGLKAALRHLRIIEGERGLTDSIREIGGLEVAKIANEARFKTTDEAERNQWRDISRAGRELNQQVSSMAGQVLNTQRQLADEVRTADDAVAEADKQVATIQGELITPETPKSVVDAMKTASDKAGEDLNNSISGKPIADAKRSKSFMAIIRQVGKGLGIDFRRIMQTGELSQEAAKAQILGELKKLPQLATMTDAELKNLAGNLDSAWREIRQKVFLQEFKKAVGLPTVSKAEKKAITETLPEIVKMSNLGLLNEQSFRDVIAKKLGLPVLDEATAKRIYDLGKKIDELLSKSDGKDAETHRMVQSLRNEVDMTVAALRAKSPLTTRGGRIAFAKSANEYLIMQALGTLQFHGRQIFDVGGQSVIQAISRAYASAAVGEGGKAQKAGNFIRELWQTGKDLETNLKEARIHAVEGLAGRSLQYKNSLGFKNEMMLFERNSRALNAAVKAGRYDKAIGHWLFGLIGTPRRYLMAMDELSGTLTHNTEIRQAVAEQAGKIGMSRAESNQWFVDAAKEVAGNVPLIESQMQAKYGDEWSKLPKNQRRAIVHDVMDSMLMEKVKSLGMDADAINTAANRKAMTEAWNTREIGYGFGGLIGQGLENLKQAMESRGIPPIGTQFANSIAIGINRTLSSGGLGFFPDLFAQNKATPGQPKKQNSFFADEKMRQQRKSEAAAGLAVMATLAGLAASGTVRVRNMLPKDEEERKKLINEGHTGNSIEFNLGNGKFVQVGTGTGLFAPFRLGIAGIGAWQDRSEKFKVENDRIKIEAGKKGLTLELTDDAWWKHLGVSIGYSFIAGLGGQRTVGGGLSGIINPQSGEVDLKQPLVRYGTQVTPFMPMVKSVEKVSGDVVDNQHSPFLYPFAPVAITGANKSWPLINSDGDEVGAPMLGRVVGTVFGGGIPLVVDGKNYAKHDDLVALKYRAQWHQSVPSEKEFYASKDGKYRKMEPNEYRNFIVQRGAKLRELIKTDDFLNSVKEMEASFDADKVAPEKQIELYQKFLNRYSRMAGKEVLSKMGLAGQQETPEP